MLHECYFLFLELKMKDSLQYSLENQKFSFEEYPTFSMDLNQVNDTLLDLGISIKNPNEGVHAHKQSVQLFFSRK